MTVTPLSYFLLSMSHHKTIAELQLKSKCASLYSPWLYPLWMSTFYLQSTSSLSFLNYLPLGMMHIIKTASAHLHISTHIYYLRNIVTIISKIFPPLPAAVWQVAGAGTSTSPNLDNSHHPDVDWTNYRRGPRSRDKLCTNHSSQWRDISWISFPVCN